MMKYRYYSTQRPVAPGTFPNENVDEIKNFDDRTAIPEINRSAWGYIDYKQPLTDKTASSYELVFGGEISE